MARKHLRQLNGERMRFEATISRFGHKSAFRGPPIPTILLTNVKNAATGEVLTDHVWVTHGKTWGNCQEGQQVAFDARVTSYIKGYKGYRDDVFDAPLQKDYRLSNPTKVVFY